MGPYDPRSQSDEDKRRSFVVVVAHGGPRLEGSQHSSTPSHASDQAWDRHRAVEFGCLKVVNQMSYLTVGSLENTSRLVDVSLNWTINSTG